MKSLLLIVCSLLCFIGSLCPQGSPPPPHQWTLQECIQYVRQNNLQVKSLRLGSAAALQDLSQSENNLLPSVAGSTSQSWLHRDHTAAGNESQQANSFTSNYGVNSSVVLYNGGSLRNSIEAARLAVQMANLSVEEATNDITLSITQAFLNILLAKENITRFEELLATSQAQFKQGQERYDQGAISKKVLLQFQSQVASDNYNLINARNMLSLDILTLKQVLQLPADYDMDVAVPAQVEPQEAYSPLVKVQKAALDTRPEVKSRELALRLSEVDRERVKAGRLPSVSLGAGLYSGYSNYQNPKYFSQLDKNFYQSISLGVTIPIFSRRQNMTALAKSDIAIEQSKLDLQGTRITLTQQVERAYINLLNAQAQYRAAADQLKAAEEIYAITQEQLRWGAINMVEVLQQKALYTQAVQAFVQAKYTAVLYNKIYQFYAGEPISF